MVPDSPWENPGRPLDSFGRFGPPRGVPWESPDNRAVARVKKLAERLDWEDPNRRGARAAS
jgi:hypothetical protein